MDHLGSVVATVPSSGAILDYAPFGQIVSGSTPDPYKFTGKERDSESGLDYFGARYYGSNMGRFMSPDWTDATDPIPYADLSNPQTLNPYAYVGNNPLSKTDSTGHSCDPDTYSRNANGDLVVTAGACHSDFSFLSLAGLAGGVGHHYIPQAFSKTWQPGWAKDIANKTTSGPLIQGAKANLNDKLQRLTNAKTVQLIKQYLTDKGKTAEQLTKEDSQALASEIKSAGAEFETRLTTETPGARDTEAALEKAFHSVADSGFVQGTESVVQGVEETVQENCPGGSCL